MLRRLSTGICATRNASLAMPGARCLSTSACSTKAPKPTTRSTATISTNTICQVSSETVQRSKMNFSVVPRDRNQPDLSQRIPCGRGIVNCLDCLCSAPPARWIGVASERKPQWAPNQLGNRVWRTELSQRLCGRSGASLTKVIRLLRAPGR